MLTPQEVSTRAFSKAMMGGYNMAAVDEFLDELTDDYTALYKENASLKAKLKVLVEKVEEYRATEDSMRATLLTAQKMADSIVHEAEEEREQLLQEAKELARAQIADSQKELEASKLRMQQGQQELARFITASRDLCQRQVDFLEQLPQAKVQEEPPQTPPEPPVQEIEEKVMAAFTAAAPEQPEEPAAVPEPEADDAGGRFTAPEEPTRRINLEELKFGRNYSGEE